MSELEGRVVAITGAARGMGRAYARGFLTEGAKVVAMDQSWEPTGFSGDNDDSFLKELEAAHGHRFAPAPLIARLASEDRTFYGAFGG